MPLIGARMQPNEIAQIDQIATAAQVTRAVIIRWALRDYVRRFLMPVRPAEGTGDHHGVIAPIPGVAVSSQPDGPSSFHPHSGQGDDGSAVAPSDGACAQQVFGAASRAHSGALAAAWANQDGANDYDDAA